MDLGPPVQGSYHTLLAVGYHTDWWVGACCSAAVGRVASDHVPSESTLLEAHWRDTAAGCSWASGCTSADLVMAACSLPLVAAPLPSSSAPLGLLLLGPVVQPSYPAADE